MSDPSKFTADELAHQAAQHLDSLRTAGVGWLPFAPLPTPPAVAERDTAEVAAPRSSLFADDSVGPSAVASGPALTIDERRQALRVLAEEVAGCTRCPGLASTRTQTVFGVGEPGVELCFVGEAPGADEDAQGEPFVGAAGQLLNRIIAACHLKREEVYICNTLKCRPPGNRTPQPDEIAHCKGYLERQLELVRPRFICALGRPAAQTLLNTGASLGQLRGRFHDYRGIPVMVTYHPAYLLPHRHPEMKKDVWADMKTLMARMGRPIP
jgi:DNA polymerase